MTKESRFDTRRDKKDESLVQNIHPTLYSCGTLGTVNVLNLMTMLWAFKAWNLVKHKESFILIIVLTLVSRGCQIGTVAFFYQVL
jgi:hypothetical protein